MTKEQTAKVLYSMTEGINVKEMFDILYCDILSINDRTKVRLGHVDPYLIKQAIEIEVDGKSLDDNCRERNYYRTLYAACTELVQYGVTDVSIYELSPMDYTDNVLIRLHNKNRVCDGIIARTLTNMMIATEEELKVKEASHDTRSSAVNIVLMPDMKLIAGSLSNRYYYHTIAHELIHCILHHLNYADSNFVYYKALEGNQDVVELLCDIWGFVLCDYIKEPYRYKDMSLFDAYINMLKLANREYGGTMYYDLYKTIVDELGMPSWVTDLIGTDIKWY